MAGDGLVRPLNAPPAGALSPGVQPGVSQAVVVANKVIVFGANGGVFVYSGSPALGNLISSISGAASTDLYGNAVLAGEVNYTPVAGGVIALQINAGQVFWYHAATEAGPYVATAEISTDASGTILTVTATSLRALLEGDGNVYNMASLTVPVTPTGQVINSQSALTVNNLTVNVVAGVTYRFRGEIQFSGNQAAGTANFQLGTNGTFSSEWGDAEIHDAVTGTSAYVARPTAFGPFTSPTLTANNWFMKLDAMGICTGNGTISLQAFCSVAADTFTIKNGFLEIVPLA